MAVYWLYGHRDFVSATPCVMNTMIRKQSMVQGCSLFPFGMLVMGGIEIGTVPVTVIC